MSSENKETLKTLIAIKNEKLSRAEKELKKKREELHNECLKLKKAEQRLLEAEQKRHETIEKFYSEIDAITTARKIEQRRHQLASEVEPSYKQELENVEKQKKAVLKAEQAVFDARKIVIDLLKKIEKFTLSLDITVKKLDKEQTRKDADVSDELGSAGFVAKTRETAHRAATRKK